MILRYGVFVCKHLTIKNREDFVRRDNDCVTINRATSNNITAHVTSNATRKLCEKYYL